MNVEAQTQRKLPIREGGQTIDAGNISESIHAIPRGMNLIMRQDPDDDGDGLLDVSAVATDPRDSDGDGYGDYSVRKK